MPTLAETVHFHKMVSQAHGRPGPRKGRPGRPRYPRAIEISYAARLRAHVDLCRQVMRQVLLPALPGLAREAGIRTDSYAQSLYRVMQLVRATSASVDPGFRPEELARIVGRQINGFSKRDVLAMMGRAVGVDVFLADRKAPGSLEAFVHQNVQLIGSITNNYFDRVEQDILTGLRSGRRVSDLAEVLEADYAMPAARAELVARDQVGKFNGQLNQLRQEELGIETYIWRGVLDEREREMHLDLEGQEFRWDDPPVTNEKGETNHPGQDIQCRCTAEPVVKI